jgi:hypothetical protein
MIFQTEALPGGWLLVGIFVLAIAVHVLHGTYNVGNLVIYTAAAWAVAAGKTGAQKTG